MKNSLPLGLAALSLSIAIINPLKRNTSWAPPAGSEVRYISSAILTNISQIKNFQAAINIKSSTPKMYFDEVRSVAKDPNSGLNPNEISALQQLPTTDQESSRTANFTYKSPYAFITTYTDAKFPEILRSESLIVDDKKSYLLQEYDKFKGQSKKLNDKSGFYSFGFVDARTNILKNGLFGNFEAFDPRAYMHFEYPGGQSLDKLFLRPDRSPSYRGEEMMEGSRCMKVEVSLAQDAKTLYWIDVEHDFLLRRREQRVGKKLLLVNDTRVPRLQESNGVWFPAIVETRRFLEPIKAEPGKSLEDDPSSVIFSRITVSDFKANTDIPNSTFVMKWPKGTNVRNQITQTGFVANGDQINEGEELKADVLKQAPAAAASVGTARQDKTNDVQGKPTP